MMRGINPFELIARVILFWTIGSWSFVVLWAFYTVAIILAGPIIVRSGDLELWMLWVFWIVSGWALVLHLYLSYKQSRFDD